jgi:hypothetical protein
MTGRLTIAKLEALLMRVRTRAGEPRAGRAVASAAARAPAVVDGRAEELEQEDDQPTLPPPPVVEASPQAARPVDIDVVVEEERTVIAVAVTGPDSPALSLESKERLVVAQPPASFAEEEAAPDLEGAPEISQVQEEEVDADVGEEPPVSSRRPVMPEPEERLAEMAFGAEEPSPLRHAPPPESGRLPAAPAQFESSGDVKAGEELPASKLVPEAIRSDLGTSARVVDVIGEAQRFAPSSFAELLDASLAL